MSLVNTTVKPFEATAFVNGSFVPVSSSDIEGKWAIFFFYPADFTFVCPTELGDLADHYEELKALGVEVYSVSTDTHFTHKAWHEVSDTIRKVTYPMVGDPTHRISRNFKILRKGEGLADRGTFLVDPDGVIQHATINNLSVGRSVDETLRVIEAFQYTLTHGEVCPANWTPKSKAMKATDAGLREYFKK